MSSIDVMELFVEVADGNTVRVRELLDDGFDPNSRCEEILNTTVLIKAAWQGHVDIARMLLEEGADITAVTSIGETALMYAASEGRPKVVDLLLKAGASVNDKDKAGHTALVRAAYSGHISIVQGLLDAGADMELRDNYGDTALFWAKDENNYDVVALLEDIERRKKHGQWMQKLL